MRVVLVMVAVASMTRGAHADREVRISISQGTADGHAGASAEVVFSDGPAWGVVVASWGPCAVRAPLSKARLAAGTIDITGTSAPVSLPESSQDSSGKRKVMLAPPAFTPGTELVVHAAEGPDVRAFTASVTAPSALAGYTPPKVLSRAGTRFEWAPASGGDIMILIGATDDVGRNPMFLNCRVSDVGHFDVPRAAFALLPSSHRIGFVLVARIAETQQMVGDVKITIDAQSVIGAGPLPLENPAPPPPPSQPAPFGFFSVGLGFAGTNRLGEVPPTVGTVWSLQLGYRLARKLQLVVQTSFMSGEYTSTTAAYSSEERTSLGVGIRWSPFAGRPQRTGAFAIPIFPGAPAATIRTST